MTQDTGLSILRSLLTLIGSYLVGHAIFGHTVTADIWTVIGGAAATVFSTVWGIVKKTATIDSSESAIHSVLLTLGGLFVSAGVINQDTLTAILGLVGSISPILLSQISKSKVQLIEKGKLKAMPTGKVQATKVLMILVLCMLGIAGNAQSLFKALPKPKDKISIVDSPAAGSNYTGFRFTGPTIMYGVTPNSFSNAGIFTFVGIDFENDYWDAAAKKFYTTYAVGLQAGEGGQFAPSNLSAVTAAALTLSTQKLGSWELPFKLTAGFIYIFSTKTGMAGVGPGIPLNN